MQSQSSAVRRSTRTARNIEGIEPRHLKACASRDGRRCSCQPGYRAVVVIERDGPERRRKSKTFSTLAAAQAWRREALLAVENGRLRASARITFRAAGEQYVAGARDGAMRNRSGDVYKPSAVRGIEEAFRLRLNPAFGPRKLADVRRAELQRLIDRMQLDGSSPSTIRNTINAARALYRHAIRHDVVLTDPTDGLALPAVRGRRERVASPQEAERLLAALPATERGLWATAMYAGLRLGELRALLWADVDLASGVIRVQRSWDVKAGPVAPKSRAGTRKVPITGVLRDLLVEHRMQQGRDDGLVFGRTAGLTLNPSTVAQRAARAWQAAGLEAITLHECRHTFASMMIAAGVNAKALATYMGHASVTITFDRYGHLMPGSEDEAANLLDAYLSRAREAGELIPVV
jgi:integrase